MFGQGTGRGLQDKVVERYLLTVGFQQIVDPYREQAARLLEIDPDEIDFTQSEYVKALTYQDERGEQRPMSFTEFGDYIRQTRSFGYEYTDQARNKAYQVANDLANLFGKA